MHFVQLLWSETAHTFLISHAVRTLALDFVRAANAYFACISRIRLRLRTLRTPSNAPVRTPGLFSFCRPIVIIKREQQKSTLSPCATRLPVLSAALFFIFSTAEAVLNFFVNLSRAYPTITPLKSRFPEVSRMNFFYPSFVNYFVNLHFQCFSFASQFYSSS